jgi:hypothetical protein
MGVRIGPRLGIAESAHEAVGRQLGDPLPTGRARLYVRIDGFGRRIVKLAHGVVTQRLVGGMLRFWGVHQFGLPLRVRVAVKCTSPGIKRRNVARLAAKMRSSLEQSPISRRNCTRRHDFVRIKKFLVGPFFSRTRAASASHDG